MSAPVDVLKVIRRWKHEVCATGTEELHDAELAIKQAIEALRDVDSVVQQWRESGREPAYGQWLNVQDVVRAALARMQANSHGAGVSDA